MATDVMTNRPKVQFRMGPAGLALRVLFGVLERLAPRLGGRLAARLWCTPPRNRRAQRRLAASSGVPASAGMGEPLTIDVDGRVVAAHAWGRGPVVYLVHGWGGWRGQLEAFVAPLVTAGFRVVSFDALSHGASDPGALGRRRSALPELAATLTTVVRAVGPANAVVAHSLGGSATALAVLDGLVAHRLVFIGALADPIAYTRDFAQALGFGERVRTDLLARLERFSGRPAAEFDVPGRLAAAQPAADRPLPPLLVIHDVDDKEVGYCDGQLLAGRWPAGDLLTTSGLGHRRILRDPGVVKSVVDYLSK